MLWLRAKILPIRILLRQRYTLLIAVHSLERASTVGRGAQVEHKHYDEWLDMGNSACVRGMYRTHCYLQCL